MTQTIQRPGRDIIVAKSLIALAVLGALTAVAAGLVLIIATPESGSSAEGARGFTAAAGGMSAAVFAGAAAIYAQIRNLWQYAPGWVRVAAWSVLAFAILSGLWRSITETN